MLEYQPSSLLAKRPKFAFSTERSTASISTPSSSVLPVGAMNRPMVHSGPSSKLRTRPKLHKSTVASGSSLAATSVPPLVHPQFSDSSVEAVVPTPQFYGLPKLASPFGGHIHEDEDRHVRFKIPLVEGTLLHIRQATQCDNGMEGIVNGEVQPNSPQPQTSLSRPLPPPPIPFKTRPRLVSHPPSLPIVTRLPTPPSPASDPMDFPSTPDNNFGRPSSREECQSPKWPLGLPPSSPTTADSESSAADSLEDEGMDELADDDDDDEVEIVEVRNDDEVQIVEVRNDEEVEIVEGRKLQATVEIGQGDDMAQTGGKPGKGKEKVVEDQGEPRIEESAYSVRSFLVRPSIEDLIKHLNPESGSGEEISTVEVRRTAKARKADLVSRLLEAELYLASAIDQLHDCITGFAAGSLKT